MPYYAGVGSRETPKDICEIMTQIASVLEGDGYILRSGGASGADLAFERGVVNKEHKQIFIPKIDIPSEAAYEIVSKIHPAWHRCNEYARLCHGRNAYQVLGKTLQEPVEFVICWTPGGTDSGGTRTAIVLARSLNIPVYNLGNPNDYPVIVDAILGLGDA